ncbi:glycosyltransferase family 2 protein [Paenibacillus harenae]|uniref:glycosyltransferase family 2 protein n=1 Tax=Paenibacillus harenae TaxID=306543 RepID=UPI0027906999|nr:glycosyltransferase family 2 protein [Paenibacillus harenae]MDQ0060624.1 rhamnosyltransferase [Paenibacillus harenae]
MHTDQQSAYRISVIIPTLNAGPALHNLLDKLQNQTYRPHEIIVIDSESIDGTPQSAKQAGARVITVRRSEFDHGGTRNMAVEAAEGNILLFMTQDAEPLNEHMIEELTKPLRAGNEVVYAYARQCARPEADILEQLARRHNYPEKSQVKSFEHVGQMGIKTFFCSNVCAAIRKETFEAMGRFQAPVIFNEDLFMSARCILSGFKVAYCAEALVYHSHHYSLMQQLRRYFDNGVSMSCNSWIMPYSAVGKAGSSLVKQQLKALIESRRWLHIPHLMLEAGAKLVGYKLGIHFRKLPTFMRRRLSMHKHILERYIEQNRAMTD